MTSRCHQQYMADIAASSRTALDTVDPTPYFVKYGENTGPGSGGYLDAVAARAATPVIEKYTGVLASADVFPRARRSTSCSRCVSTWATAHRFTPELDYRPRAELIGAAGATRMLRKPPQEGDRRLNKELGVWTHEDCALVLIDYQKEMFEVIRSETDAALVELHVRLLAKIAKALEMPIVLSTVGVGLGFNGPTLPSILAELEGVEPIDRSSMNAFEDHRLPRCGEGDRAQAPHHRWAHTRDLPHVRNGPGSEGRLRRDVRHGRCRCRSQVAHRTAIERLSHAAPCRHRTRGQYRAVP